MGQVSAADVWPRLEQNAVAFGAFNRRKLDRVRSRMAPAKRLALDLVPPLLHFKSIKGRGPLGRAPADAPTGIAFYRPSTKLTVRLAREVSGIDLPTVGQVREAGQGPIQSLLLMGSLGSAGQSAASDFDFWVVIDRSRLGQAGERLLAEKCDLIKAWMAKKAGLAATFFLVDVADVRRNDFGSTGGESAGSALAMLLKEEFYRSMTLLAGRAPWWWIVPPGLDESTQARLLGRAETERPKAAERFIDLGPLGRIDSAEFFGASLWEINKGLDQPYKSALKLLLIEAYAADESHTGPTLLAEEMKRRVLVDGEPLPDSYLLMFERVDRHLTKLKREEDRRLIRICLYLKADPQLTAADIAAEKPGPLKKPFIDYFRQWGWKRADLEDLNAYADWTFAKRRRLGEQVNRLILDCYHRLAKRSRLSRMEGDPLIDPRDLTALGRRLSLYYNRSADKIPYLPSLLEQPRPLTEVKLTALGRAKGGGGVVWQAVEPSAGAGSAPGKLISTLGLPGLLAWLSVNQLADAETIFSLQRPAEPGLSDVTVGEIKALFRVITQLFGELKFHRPTREQLSTARKMTTLLVVPNLDAALRETGLKSIGLVAHTTWGELYAKELPDPAEALTVTRKMATTQDGLDPPRLVVHLPHRPSSRNLAATMTGAFTGCPIEYLS